MIEVIQIQRTTKTNFVKYESVHTQNLNLHRKTHDKKLIKYSWGPSSQRFPVSSLSTVAALLFAAQDTLKLMVSWCQKNDPWFDSDPVKYEKFWHLVKDPEDFRRSLAMSINDLSIWVCPPG